jgi:hypothetical protein
MQLLPFVVIGPYSVLSSFELDAYDAKIVHVPVKE